MTEATNQHSKDEPSEETSWPDRVRAIIQNCADIPQLVREAQLARVDERIIDDSLFRFLTERSITVTDDEVQMVKRQRRTKALSPYLGRSLVCVLITLPGVRYTIEVDTAEERVVYWEWQAG